MRYPDIRDFHKLQGKEVDLKVSWEQLNDIVYYLEWKLTEISEAGCDLEFPEVEDALKSLETQQYEIYKQGCDA
jgi:hypothetical protein